MSSYLKGWKGEEKAVQYLEGKGYKILERRFRSGPGEVDIIVRKNDTVVFVEVKSWNALDMDNLEHSVDIRKQNKIRQTAVCYLYRHPELGDCRIRFDLIFLSWKMREMEHWEDAF